MCVRARERVCKVIPGIKFSHLARVCVHTHITFVNINKNSATLNVCVSLEYQWMVTISLHNISHTRWSLGVTTRDFPTKQPHAVFSGSYDSGFPYTTSATRGVFWELRLGISLHNSHTRCFLGVTTRDFLTQQPHAVFSGSYDSGFPYTTSATSGVFWELRLGISLHNSHKRCSLGVTTRDFPTQQPQAVFSGSYDSGFPYTTAKAVFSGSYDSGFPYTTATSGVLWELRLGISLHNSRNRCSLGVTTRDFLT
jgi:hypothetical protein